MPIVADKPEAAQVNRELLESSAGQLRLPRGVVFVDRYIELHQSGLDWIGDQTTIKSLKGNCLVVDGRPAGCGSYQSNGEVIAPLGPDEVGYLFTFTGGLFGRGPSTRFVGAPPSPLPADVTNMIRVRNAWPCADAKKGSKTLKVANAASHFAVGDDCFITDGTWSNQLAREWNVVTKATATTLNLKHALTRDHRQCAVSNCRELPRDNVFRGIRWEAELSPVTLHQALRSRFIACGFVRNDRFGHHDSFVTPIDCGFTEFVGCDLAHGLHLGQAYRTTLTDCLLAYLTAEEHSTHTDAKRCTIAASGPDPFGYNGRLDTSNHCTDWKLTDCRLYGRAAGAFIYERWAVTRLKAYCTGDITVRGQGAVLTKCETDGRIAVEAAYEGAPEGAGTGVVIDQCRLDWLWLKPGTSGNVAECTLARETDQTEAGAWVKSEIMPGE